MRVNEIYKKEKDKPAKDLKKEKLGRERKLGVPRHGRQEKKTLRGVGSNPSGVTLLYQIR